MPDRILSDVRQPRRPARGKPARAGANPITGRTRGALREFKSPRPKQSSSKQIAFSTHSKNAHSRPLVLSNPTSSLLPSQQKLDIDCKKIFDVCDILEKDFHTKLAPELLDLRWNCFRGAKNIWDAMEETKANMAKKTKSFFEEIQEEQFLFDDT
jgi:hypothetical protein